MRRSYILDTCIWREAAYDRKWLRRLCVGDAEVTIADEAVKELAVTALRAKDSDAYEMSRLACVLASRYAAAALGPIEWHLARQAGLVVRAGPDPLRVCEIIAACHSRADLASQMHALVSVGGGASVRLKEWLYQVEAEKREWVGSITDAIERAVPGIMKARSVNAPQRIDQSVYEVRKRELLSDVAALARIEIYAMRGQFSREIDAGSDDMSLLKRVQDALTHFSAMFTEAVLDLFDGPHNASAKKIRFELNDWYDLAQLRYLQGDRCWITSDGRWVELAQRAGLANRVKHGTEVSG